LREPARATKQGRCPDWAAAFFIGFEKRDPAVADRAEQRTRAFEALARRSRQGAPTTLRAAGHLLIELIALAAEENL